MSEKQFDIFDEQFKNASEQFEPAFHEAAWEKMSARLDKEQNRRRPFAWLWWFSDALMISLMLYMAITLYDNYEAKTNQPGINAGPGKKGTKITAESSIANTNSAGSKQSPAESSLNGDVADPRTNQENSLQDQQRQMIGKRKGNDQPASLKLNNDAADADKPAATALDKSPVASGQTDILNSTSKEINVPANNTTNTNQQVNNQSLPGAEETVVAGISEPSGNSIADSGKSIGPNTINSATVVSKKTAGNNPGFYLHAGLAPEWSYIKGNDAGPITLAFGGGVGYVFGKKWSVQAGVYSTQKNYTAGPGDYKPNPGTYYYNLKIYHVDAKCDILEIPVTVNYTFLHRTRHNMFASLGFASLVMQKEMYDYDYQRMNGQQAYSSHTYKTYDIHAFAATMLSVGYQLKLNKRLYLNAAPYAKIPMYGVGEGNVKIGSAGLMMGLQYQLPTCRKQKN